MKRFVCLTLLLLLSMPAATLAEGPGDMAGWEKDAPYNQLYDSREIDAFKGYVKKIFTVVPMPGMAPATAILVEEAEDSVNLVHVCPEWFAGPNDIGLRRGDRVNVKGVWAEIDGEFAWIYFVAPEPDTDDAFIVDNDLLADTFDDQVMMTNLHFNSAVRTAMHGPGRRTPVRVRFER